MQTFHDSAKSDMIGSALVGGNASDEKQVEKLLSPLWQAQVFDAKV